MPTAPDCEESNTYLYVRTTIGSSLQVNKMKQKKNYVNTQEYMQIHDTQSEVQENTLETPADKTPNWASFGY
jgi:hypothetical protein